MIQHNGQARLVQGETQYIDVFLISLQFLETPDTSMDVVTWLLPEYNADNWFNESSWSTFDLIWCFNILYHPTLG